MNQLKQFAKWGLGLFLLCLLPITVLAQEPTPATPAPTDPIPQYHIVQSGETLTSIAEENGVTVADLTAVNNLDENALLQVGQQLLIPGGEGQAIATAYTIQAGDSLAGIAAMFNTTVEALAAGSRLIQREPVLIVGDSLPLISRNGSALPVPVNGRPYPVIPGESLLMVAARFRLSPAALAQANGLPYPATLFPGQRLRLPGQGIYRDLPGGWVDVQVGPLPIKQGNTISIYAANLDDGRPLGELAGQPLHFSPSGSGYVALVGLDAFTDPGLVRLALSGSGNRPWVPLESTLRVESADYGQQLITIPDELSDLLAPEIRQTEDEFLNTIYTRFREEQLWQGVFQMPVGNSVVTAGYGAARSYNGGPFDIFHTGVDFAGGLGTFILAPAGGEVMFVGELTLRGNTVIIDHGLGIMSAYFHLERPLVAVGDRVTTGQQIGVGGNTGLSTGPHLHWDLRVNGVAVDGRQWLETVFPMSNGQ